MSFQVPQQVPQGFLVCLSEDDEGTFVPSAGVVVGVLKGGVSCLNCLLSGCQIGSDDHVQAFSLWLGHFLNLDSVSHLAYV